MKSLSVLLLSSVLLTSCGTVSLQYAAGEGNSCTAKGSGLMGASYANTQFERCTSLHPSTRNSAVEQN